ncbi:MAG: hypothetical protein ACXAC5_04875 [Promethearchaeota archaeon]|jgi:hypothetical protein
MKEKNKPSDYYFYPVEADWYEEFGCYEDFDQTPEVDVTVFYISPKEYYDRTGYMYDGCIQNEVDVPENFGEAMEGCYEIEASKEKGKQILLNAGFIEKYIGPPWGGKAA